MLRGARIQVVLKLALLSGKGGSGKTTIALSLAKMLSDCGIKTLLIDCDTATNGATYFFETKLEKKEQYVSLASLFSQQSSFVETLLQVDNNFWFIPANTSFPTDNDDLLYRDKNAFTNSLDVLGATNEFSVIIFDCQAGYSKILNTILESSTTNLVVLEPDAISSSSIRVLYAQVSSLIEKTKTFQIFNKITDDEYSVYKQIVGGTTFNSLPPIKFNWEVRKAFAFAKVPEMVSTNIEFGKNVFELANHLFPTLEKSLFDYTRKILIQEKEELELEMKKLEATKYDADYEKGAYTQKNVFDSAVMPVFSIFTVVSSITIMMFISLGSDLGSRSYIYVILILTTFFLLASYLIYARQNMAFKRKYRERIKKLQASYDYEHTKLVKRISEIDKTVSQSEKQ